MEGVREFLESSTIHGLSHIASSKQHLRVFWSVVVLASFLLAGGIIRASVLSWEETPVSTTIETLPITEVTFPLVTVCPPKSRYTNLNYDLMSLENARIDDQTKARLSRLAVRLINDALFEKDLLLMKVESGPFNWYRGYDSITLAQKSEEKLSSSPRTVTWEVTTYASSGSVSTVGFREPFEERKFPLYSKQKVIISLPKEIQYVENASIVIRIEHDTESRENIKFRYDNIDLSKKEPLLMEMPVKWCGRLCAITFDRRMEEDYFKRWKSKRLTGMNISWYYNTSVQSQGYFTKRNENFIRMVNIIQQSDPKQTENIWEFVKEVKSNWTLNVGIYDFEGNERAFGNLIRAIHISNFQRDLETAFHLVNISSEPMDVHITSETLKTASEMFLYLSVYPDSYWLGWMRLYKELLEKFSLRTIITTLAGISSHSDEIQVSNIFLNQMSDILNMTFMEIDSLTSSTEAHRRSEGFLNRSGMILGL